MARDSGKRRPSLLSPEAALRCVLRCVRPLGGERIPLAEAAGRWLAQDVRADRDMPPADRSAVDGFAVRAADLAGGGRALALVGESAAGRPFGRALRPGQCVRVLTGANVPRGADAVVMQEDAVEGHGRVRFAVAADAGDNIRRRGEEARKGATILSRGQLLGPMQAAFCAAAWVGRPRVGRLPRVAILCTGAELGACDARVGPHQVRDSNGPMIRAVLGRWPAMTLSHELVGDDPRRLTERLRRAAAGHDVVLLTGGVSVGKYDFVPRAAAAIGATLRFHGLAIKPGKPQLYATLPGNRHVFGLPGNPLSVMVGLSELVLPAIRRLAGCPRDRCCPASRLPLARDVRARPGRTLYVLARLARGGKTSCGVEPLPSLGSADVVSATQADGVIVVPADAGTLTAGTPVDFHPWRDIPLEA